MKHRWSMNTSNMLIYSNTKENEKENRNGKLFYIHQDKNLKSI